MFYSTVKLSNTWQVSFLPSVKIMTNVRNYIFLACRLRWVNFIRLSCPIRAFIVTISALRLGKKSRARRQAAAGSSKQQYHTTTSLAGDMGAIYGYIVYGAFILIGVVKESIK